MTHRGSVFYVIQQAYAFDRQLYRHFTDYYLGITTFFGSAYTGRGSASRHKIYT